MTATPRQLDLIVPALGLALFLCLIGRNFAKQFHIPKVSVFIFIGILLGPTGLNLISEDMVFSLNIFSEAALGMILFNIGGAFNKELVAKIDRHRLSYTILMAHLVCLLVFVFFFLLSSFVPGLSLVERLTIGLFLSIVSIEAAPPTTLLVMKEFNSKGPVTEIIMSYLAIGTFMAIIGAKVLTVFFEAGGIWASTGEQTWIKLLLLAWGIFGSLASGVFMGLIISYWERKENNFGDIFFVIVTAIVFGQSLAHFLKFDPLLISLTLGFTLVNASNVGQKIHASFQNMGLSIYALFFVIAGAHIHLQEQIPQMGIIGVSYIIARIMAVLISARLSNKLALKDIEVGKYIGPSVLSHAGAAIAIVTALSHREEKTAQSIVLTIMTSIFVFEIIGPLLLKKSLFDAKESTPDAPEQGKQTLKTSISFKGLVRNLLINTGIKKENKKEENLHTIKSLIATDVVAIKKNATLQTVKKYVDQNYNFYPVVDDDQRFIGLISIDALKNYITEENSSFILAETLVKDTFSLNDNTNINEALELFEKAQASRLPVVHSATKKFLGIIYYKDLLLHVDKMKKQNKLIGN